MAVRDNDLRKVAFPFGLYATTSETHALRWYFLKKRKGDGAEEEALMEEEGDSGAPELDVRGDLQ